ncbi:MAG TPA: hypothetical protein PKY38_04315 [Opitutaceae bacterium]|nr:hypothetical protein [Opitutaceae bacterium]
MLAVFLISGCANTPLVVNAGLDIKTAKIEQADGELNRYYYKSPLSVNYVAFQAAQSNRVKLVADVESILEEFGLVRIDDSKIHSDWDVIDSVEIRYDTLPNTGFEIFVVRVEIMLSPKGSRVLSSGELSEHANIRWYESMSNSPATQETFSILLTRGIYRALKK